MEIAVEQLTRTFGTVRANDAVTLRFAAGRIHGVLGENGAGKSTLMKMLAGYLRPDSGTIRVDGRAVLMRGPGDALAAGIGMVHQEPLDVPAFTALENVLCAAPRGVFRSRRDAAARLTALAQQLGFGVEPEDQLASLTVGQRQQLEILRLLLCGAQILILDEPTTGITAAQARALFDALRRLREQGRTVLFVSHKLDEVADLCDTVSVLRAGLVVDGQLEMPQPQTKLIELMFGSVAAAASVPQPAGSDPRVTWRLDGVSAQYGGMLLHGLDRTFPAGRVIGLAGLEGSGQQVLLRLLAGQIAPLRGRLTVDGVELGGRGLQAFRRAGIEFLPADRLKEGVVGELTLAEHFALLQPQSLLVDWRAAEAAARTAIEEYQIRGTPTSPPAALSGGNQQRAMLSMVPAAVRGILAEQPTRGLDVTSARAIWTRLLARRDSGATIVFATADLDEILQYSDDVIVCFSGRLSPPIAREALDPGRLAELIGGVGFAELEERHAAVV